MTQQPPADDLKPCPYCGRMTSSSANFCYYCARELVARPERPAEEPRPRQVNWLLVGIGAGVLLVVVLYLLLR